MELFPVKSAPPGVKDAKINLKEDQNSFQEEFFVLNENFRKWRLWNKKGEDDPELFSPFGSPLQSVVQFAKFTTINNSNQLRTIMLDQ